MRVLVTGSTGHLGEALMRILPDHGHERVGLDISPSSFTHIVGSITNRTVVRKAMEGCDIVLHTATLHKPHVATHSKQDFIDTNMAGTLVLLEEAAALGLSRFVFTSTTSTFGSAMRPAPGAPAAWVVEGVKPIPRNIYGVTKTAAEDLCELFARKHRINAIILRTSRFFPEEDDNREMRVAYPDTNAKANEFLNRRVDIEDAALAHLCAMDRIDAISFGKYIVSATSPFTQDDLTALRTDAPGVVARYFPRFEAIYAQAGYKMFADIGRVYVNALCREELGWQPKYDFAAILAQIEKGEPIGSALSRTVGSKGYHAQIFEDGPYPVE